MMSIISSRLPLVLTLAALLSASPTLAQGKGKGNDKGKANSGQVKKQQARPQLVRRGSDGGQISEAALREEQRRRQQVRDDDRWEDDERYDDRYDDRRSAGNGSGKVPPGWCKGKGNPHNTPENCGYASRRGTYDNDGRTRNGNYGSYEEEHAEYHRWLDRKYSDLAARRPLDPTYQIRIRAEKRAEHNRWHERMGRRH